MEWGYAKWGWYMLNGAGIYYGVVYMLNGVGDMREGVVYVLNGRDMLDRAGCMINVVGYAEWGGVYAKLGWGVC